MKPTRRYKRFTILDRSFHLFLMLTFLIQTATGFGRLFYTTGFSRQLIAIFGGYEVSFLIHKSVGVLMIAGFILHTLYLIFRLNPKNLMQSLFGPDSLIPNFDDAKHLWQKILWFFGLKAHPEIGRWAYWEKFDYWAVYWGLPLLAVTGLMMIYPLETCRYLPGWSLNLSAFLHRAEAILAATYIFIVHFYVGHLKPSSFPMNEAMFSGSVSLKMMEEERPAWLAELKKAGDLKEIEMDSPSLLYRVLYYLFGYAALGFGVYLLINGIIYSQYITMH